MMTSEVLIVGTGAAGVAAAEGLKEKDLAILDVGFQAPGAETLDCALYDLRRNRTDLFPELIGSNFESLHNVHHAYLTPKLKGPLLRFVTKDWKSLSPLRSESSDGLMSFAQGGLANAWGAGVYRFTEGELKAFPLCLADLEPYYDRLTSLIGIAGCKDDLLPFFGSAEGLQPPLQPNLQSRRILQRYTRKKRRLNNDGIFIGHPRVAVSTCEMPERHPYEYHGLEFFKPNIPAVYNPSYTLRKLLARPNIKYFANRLALRYEASPEKIRVLARDTDSGRTEVFDGKRLVLAAGTLNTAKIVLQSNDDYESRLPFLDNPISYVPFLDPWRIGMAEENRFFAGVQLNVVYAGDRFGEPIQASLYGVSGTLRSDFLMEFPFSISGNIAASRHLSPALVIVQIFYPDTPKPSNRVSLNRQQELVVEQKAPKLGDLERLYIRSFRKLGLLSLPMLAQYPPPGSSYHYAGTLPMREQPTSCYETWPSGQLFGQERIFVADGSSFPHLASKNHTFTMMANAMRVADTVNRSLS